MKNKTAGFALFLVMLLCLAPFEAAGGLPEDPPLPAESTEAAPEDAWKEVFYPVPATPAVGASYFNDVLFIGDSRVAGLMLYSGLTEATFYSEKGVSVNTVLTNPIVLLSGGEKITVPEALRQRSFGKIYIKLGLNELGWRSTYLFTEAYGKAIDRIRESQPKAVIYVQSILPVSRKKHGDSTIFDNTRIIEFNEAIKKMTWEKNVHYLDVYYGMIDEEGFLPEEAGRDGIHLNKEYCLKWVEYLKRHTFRDYNEIRL